MARSLSAIEIPKPERRKIRCSFSGYCEPLKTKQVNARRSRVNWPTRSLALAELAGNRLLPAAIAHQQFGEESCLPGPHAHTAKASLVSVSP
jgi:hypothetical protein